MCPYLIQVLKFSPVAAPAGCLWGAASLRTGATNTGTTDKITLGCLLKMENTGATINVTCRTVLGAATSALLSTVKQILSDRDE